jgi:hypothetical protein
MWLCAALCRVVPLCAALCRFVPLCADLYRFVPLISLNIDHPIDSSEASLSLCGDDFL